MKQKPLLKFELEQAGSPLSIVLYIFGVLAIIGGFIIGSRTWSNSLELGLSFIIQGFVYGIFLFIAGVALSAIFQQTVILTHIANELDRQGWDEKEQKESA